MKFTIDGSPVWFHGISGDVYSLQKWTSTSLKSDGGGGYIHPVYGGQINAPQIRSSTEQHQNFWIVSPSGHEREMSDANIRCREGQRVTLIWGASEGVEDGKYLLFYNHNTDSITFYDDAFSGKSSFKDLNASASESHMSIIIWTLAIPTLGISLLFFIPLIIKMARRIAPITQKYRLFTQELLKNPDFISSIS